ncbi:MAG: hypothetical protein HKN34_04430 [Gammaproteobacteria bacterium]|nr:hypothetical protein [Gammaproteobacteria bacterium]
MNASTVKDRNVIAGTLFALAVILSSGSVYAEDDYQQNVLFNPSPAILLAEARGRIMIYDGLKSEAVELALNEQFDRIENMMFVRTQYEQEDGEYEVEDDCD